MSLRAVTAVVAASLAWPIAAWAQAAPHDLLEAWQLARAGDPVLRAAAAERRRTHEGVAQARAALLPQAAAHAVLARTRSSLPGGGHAELGTREPALVVRQSLLDRAQWSRLGAARALDAAGEAAYTAAEQALAVRVAAAYLDVLSASDLLATTEAEEAAYAEQVRQAEARERERLAAPVSVAQARAYHAQARDRTLAARTALEDAREALAELTGVRWEALRPLREALPLDAPLDAAETWVAAALANHPLIAARRHAVQAAGQAVEAARAGHWPTLEASLDVGRPATWPGGEALGRDGRSVATAGVVLRVPLFAGGATQSQLRQALAERDIAAEDLEALSRRVARETLDQHRQAVAASQRIAATRAAVLAARQALDATRVGQQLGTQSMTDLLLAIQTLSAAQNAQAAARHRWVLARLQLAQSAGRIGEADLQAANALLQ